MNLTKAALEYKAVTYFATFLLITVGILAYFSLGQLEDPEFSVKTAAITINYPGASAEQVELEVIDLIETQIQERPQEPLLVKRPSPDMGYLTKENY